MLSPVEQFQLDLLFSKHLLQLGGKIHGLLDRHHCITRPMLDEKWRRIRPDIGFRIGGLNKFWNFGYVWPSSNDSGEFAALCSIPARGGIPDAVSCSSILRKSVGPNQTTAACTSLG